MRYRDTRGNTLIMIAAVTIVLCAVVAFILLYVSMMRSNSEHKSAIEAAAIAAAKEVSRIAVDTPQCGWVSLCSQPPIGSATNAGDDWYQEVNSINELMATARLDLILAQELGDPFMKDLALRDVTAIKAAKDILVAEIRQSLVSGGSSRDAAGNTVKPYDAAQRAYLQNQAKNTTYVADSMVLSLGGLDGGMQTSTSAPRPLSKGACAGLESDGMYLSDSSIPYQGTDFVFGSVGRRVSLCDFNKYKDTVAGLPFQMPAVVKAEAKQQFQDQGKQWVVAFNACACAGSLETPRPKPGALTVSFPDGPMPEINNISELHNAEMTKAKMDLYTAAGGDFVVDKPTAVLSPYSGSIPFPSTPPSASTLATLAMYDWLRCGGSRVNIDSVLSIQGQSFGGPSSPQIMWSIQDLRVTPPVLSNLGMIPRGFMQIYTFNPDGTIASTSVDIKPAPYTVVGENQLYAELADSKGVKSAVPKWKINTAQLPDIKTGGIKSVDIEGKPAFDIYIRDLCREIGTQAGGRHGGERMDGNPLISMLPEGQTEGPGGGPGGGPSGPGTTSTGSAGAGIPPMITRQDDFASTSIPLPAYSVYSRGPGGGAARPCYSNKNGLCADIRFRRQVDVGDLSFYLGGYKTGYVGDMQ